MYCARAYLQITVLRVKKKETTLLSVQVITAADDQLVVFLVVFRCFGITAVFLWVIQY